MKAISLFSGAGGLDLGLAEVGVETIACVEIDPHCVSTLRLNTKAQTLAADARSLDPHAVANSAGVGQVDILHGGPPCQPFSQIGNRSGAEHRDGMLIFEFSRWVKELQPCFFIVEQVKGLLAHRGVMNALATHPDLVGYNVQHQTVNALDFGVPQQRERVIFVGSRQNANILNGLKRNAFAHAMGEAIQTLPPVGSDAIPNHIDVTPDRDRERISYVKEGEWLSKSDAPPDIIRNLTRKDTTKYRRLHRSQPSLTLRCGEIFYHPTEDRYLTPREYMRLHGFPDDYELAGPIRRRIGQVSNLDQHRQVANSVPPPLAAAVGQAIIEAA